MNNFSNEISYQDSVNFKFGLIVEKSSFLIYRNLSDLTRLSPFALKALTFLLREYAT